MKKWKLKKNSIKKSNIRKSAENYREIGKSGEKMESNKVKKDNQKSLSEMEPSFASNCIENRNGKKVRKISFRLLCKINCDIWFILYSTAYIHMSKKQPVPVHVLPRLITLLFPYRITRIFKWWERRWCRNERWNS